MKKIVLIPARYHSKRFPGKPLHLINGKEMILWVYDNAIKNPQVDEVYVATDSSEILSCVRKHGGDAILTSSEHTCGTDRLAECADILGLDDEDIILNIQGDEPLLDSRAINDLLKCFEDPHVYMGTLKKKINSESEKNDPNVVKVITDVNHDAIYFSRYAIPFNRDGRDDVKYYKHIGVYAYKGWFLKNYSKMGDSKLQLIESLEQLRALENGYKIRVMETSYESLGVDIPEQISLVEERMKLLGIWREEKDV